MKQQIFTIESQTQLAPDVFRLLLTAPEKPQAVPGQFVNIALPGRYLRRPISVCDVRENTLCLIYKRIGRGTGDLSRMQPKDKLDVLTGLGNGYDLSKSGDNPLLIGGGAGIPPLYLLARHLLAEGKKVQVVLGFNTASEIFYEKEFKDLCCSVTLAAADGSAGVKGFVTDALPDTYSYFYACGPLPMLKAVCRTAQTSGQLSLEERMGCGFGACMGCSIQTAGGYRRVCKDGPVFEKEELRWED